MKKNKLIFSLTFLVMALALVLTPFVLKVSAASSGSGNSGNNEQVDEGDSQPDRGIGPNSSTITQYSTNCGVYCSVVDIFSSFSDNKIIFNFEKQNSPYYRIYAKFNYQTHELYFEYSETNTYVYTNIILTNGMQIFATTSDSRSDIEFYVYDNFDYSNPIYSYTFQTSYIFHRAVSSNVMPLIVVTDNDFTGFDSKYFPHINSGSVSSDNSLEINNNYNYYFVKEISDCWDSDGSYDLIHFAVDSNCYVNVSLNVTDGDGDILLYFYDNGTNSSATYSGYLKNSYILCSLNSANGLHVYILDSSYDSTNDSVVFTQMQYFGSYLMGDTVSLITFDNSKCGYLDSISAMTNISLCDYFVGYELYTAYSYAYQLGYDSASTNYYADRVFDECRLVGFSLNSLNDLENVLYYYNNYIESQSDPSIIEYETVESGVAQAEWVLIDSLETFYNGSAFVGVDYYYNLIIPNVTLTNSFTITFSSSNGGNLHVLYDDLTFTDISVNADSYTYSINDLYQGRSIIAIGVLNYKNTCYANKIGVTSSEVITSTYYYQGYDSGFSSGYESGKLEVDELNQSIINAKDLRIADLESQILALNNQSIDLSFKETLNTILKYPINLVKTVFYDDNNNPITLFGVSLPGVILGVFGIALSIGIIAIVKRVWK